MHLRIAHLYPKRMSIYGDHGNILTLVRRSRWRHIAASVDEIEVGQKFDSKRYDLIFFGGGQDQEQDTVAADLKKKAGAIREAVGNGAAVLAVCGGYQLLGNYYQPAEGDRLEGVGIFDAHTEAGPKRLIGNVVVEPDVLDLPKRPLVGFENHSGLTFLGEDANPLGKLKTGFGNNGRDNTEGTVQGKAIGTYLHGSLLPKNPHLADWLLKQALGRRYKNARLGELEDAFELVANEQAVERFS
ncbi:glutamine amidotransferase [Patescibacteria group bacterium]|nr:glutamine amidotransferase [Patescibacteria group bacterium]